jgi:DCN1-like protein 1/2
VEGTMKYFEALGIDLSDVSSFIVSEILQCPTMGEITREGFTDGWSDLGVDTIDKQKKLVQSRRATIGQPVHREILKKVYKHTFKLLLTGAGQRSVDKGTCIEMWKVLFKAPALDWRTPTTNWLELWTEFVEANSIKMINSDVWQQTFKFAEESIKEESLSWWSEESAWPALVDEFVEWIKEKRGDGKEENMEDVEY